MTYKSRNKRREEACGQLSTIVDKLRDISNTLEVITEINDKKAIEENIDNVIALVDGLDTSELESLKDEMESWASNMEGTNLEQTDKYSIVAETADKLADVVSTLEGITAPEIDKSNMTIEDLQSFVVEINTMVQEIEDAVSEAESVDFPGMYG